MAPVSTYIQLAHIVEIYMARVKLAPRSSLLTSFAKIMTNDNDTGKIESWEMKYVDVKEIVEHLLNEPRS